MRSILLFLLLTLCASIAWAGDTPLPGQPNEAAAAAYEKGERLLRAGKHIDAAEAFDEAARLAPLFHLAHYAAGNSLAQAGRSREAEKRYRETVAVAPRFAAGWNALGVVLLAQDRADDAVKALDRALKAEPGYQLARLHRAEALVRAGRPADGEKDARAVLEKEPANGDARVVIASAIAARGDLKGALAELDTLLSAQPSHGAGLLLRAMLHARREDLARAAEAVAQAVERAGDQPRVRSQAARIASGISETARKRGEPAVQVRALETLVVLAPRDARVHAQLGAALIVLWETRTDDTKDPAEIERARRSLERSLELDPEQENVRKLLAMYREK
jgi:tetratricopeptide (TPR) repeat protein